MDRTNRPSHPAKQRQQFKHPSGKHERQFSALVWRQCQMYSDLYGLMPWRR